MKIINNFISKSYQDLVEKELLSAYFPWYYNSRSISVVDSEEDVNSGFTHKIYSKHKPVSSYHQLVFPILTEALEKVNQECLSLIRIRAGMFTRNLNNNLPHAPHIDYRPNSGLRTCLYYVNTNNGVTIFDGKKTVKSKKNRAILFDGSNKHHSTTSTDCNYRCSINIDYNGKRV